MNRQKQIEKKTSKTKSNQSTRARILHLIVD